MVCAFCCFMLSSLFSDMHAVHVRKMLSSLKIGYNSASIRDISESPRCLRLTGGFRGRAIE